MPLRLCPAWFWESLLGVFIRKTRTRLFLEAGQVWPSGALGPLGCPRPAHRTEASPGGSCGEAQGPAPRSTGVGSFPAPQRWYHPGLSKPDPESGQGLGSRFLVGQAVVCPLCRSPREAQGSARDPAGAERTVRRGRGLSPRSPVAGTVARGVGVKCADKAGRSASLLGSSSL